MQDLSNMVVRFYLGREEAEERFALLQDFLARTGIRRVVLFSAPFAGESSFFPESYYEEYSRFLAPFVGALKKKGVEVGINSLYTIGHAYFADDGAFPFRRAITIDGEPSRGCACFADKALFPYLKKEYQNLARLYPSVIFLDDDIRAISLGQIICLCDAHIEKISARVGTVLTRAQIREALLSEQFGSNPIKQAYFECMRNDLNDMIAYLADVIHEISPETELGIMTTTYPAVTLDRDLHEFFAEGFDSRKITRCRTGMDFYREGEHKDIPRAFSFPAIQRELICDDRVEIQPEIENDIYSFFYKSNAVTHMQLMWCLSNGLQNMQLNLFRFSGTVSNYEEIANSFHDHMPMYNKMTELIPLNHRTEGVSVYTHPKALQHRRAEGGKLMYEAYWHQYLGVDGIPIGYQKDSPWQMLTGDDLMGATDEQIDAMLCRGAVMDLKAAECLVERGFGERIGIVSIEDGILPFAGERFTDHPCNGSYANEINSDYLIPGLVGEDCIKKINYREGAEVLSRIEDYRKRTLCSGVTLYQNEQGEIFCVLPMKYNLFTQFTNINNHRKYQLAAIFERIAGRPLPCFAMQEMDCVHFNRLADYNVITLYHLTTDPRESTALRYRPQGSLYYLDQNGAELPLPHRMEDDRLICEVPIQPMGVMVIVDRK